MRLFPNLGGDHRHDPDNLRLRCQPVWIEAVGGPGKLAVHSVARLRPMSAAEKVEHLLGLSLDRMHDYLWPADSLDPYRPAAQAQVIRVVAMVAAKVGKEARRARRAALGTLNRTLPGDCPEDAKPSDVKSPSHERTCRRTHSAKHARPCTYITQFKRVLVNK